MILPTRVWKRSLASDAATARRYPSIGAANESLHFLLIGAIRQVDEEMDNVKGSEDTPPIKSVIVIGAGTPTERWSCISGTGQT